MRVDSDYATAVADHAHIRIANPTFDFLVFIGRFQPLHRAHVHVISHALKSANYVIVAVGSANAPRGHRNPFTFEERAEMIRGAIPEADRDRVLICAVEDCLYNDQDWITQVQRAVMEKVEDNHDFAHDPRIGLIGYSKDGSSYYLNLFPQWGGHLNVEPAGGRILASTDMREQFFGGASSAWLHAANDILPANVISQLSEFAKTPDYRNLLEEYEKVREYWKASHVGMFEHYEPTFNTVDSVVIQSGHILLIKRAEFPFKECWAFPGGFIEKGEELLDASIRELREETRIRVPDPVLRGSMRLGPKEFAYPYRDPRGRFITHAFLYVLTARADLPDVRPRVQGRSDAKEAKWWPLSEVSREMMAFDHFDVLKAIQKC